MGQGNKEIVQFDMSASGIPLAVKLAMSGYDVVFATYDGYVAEQLNEYSFSTHRIPRRAFTRLKIDEKIYSTTDVEGAVSKAKTLVVSAHGIDEGLKNKKNLMNALSKFVGCIRAETLFVYCGISPPGTMDGICRVINEFSSLQIDRDILMAMMTFPMLNVDRYIVCSTNKSAIEETKGLLSKLVPRGSIETHENFIEAESANIAIIAKSIMMDALSSYIVLLSRELDVKADGVLKLSKLEAPSTLYVDPLYESFIKYLVSMEVGLPRRLTLMRGVIFTKRMYMELVKHMMRKKIKGMVSRRKRTVRVAAILEYPAYKELIEEALPKRNVEVHYMSLDELVSRFEDGAKKILPFNVNLIILAVQSFKVPEGVIRELESEAEVLDLSSTLTG